MEKLQLQAETRTLEGASTNSLRREGLIPAELYGHGIPNAHLRVKRNEFEKLFRKAGESTIVELLTQDGSKHNVLVHDVQKHFLTGSVIHIDFYEVSMTEKLIATIALEFIGESKAVKELGGTLVKIIDEVEVECLPADLPHNLPVDISNIKTFDDVITAGQIPLPSGVTLVTPPDETVVKVQPPREVEAELSAPVVEDVASVGTVEKKKEDEEVVE